jgi:ABC-type uncharacterized transport system involved in gliding motility auxiliary subunit
VTAHPALKHLDRALDIALRAHIKVARLCEALYLPRIKGALISKVPLLNKREALGERVEHLRFELEAR